MGADEAVRLVLPLPPSVNHAYRNFMYKGRRMRVLTKDAETFKDAAGWSAKAWAVQQGWEPTKRGQKVAMRVWCYWANARRRDTDNVMKLLNDSLTGILYEDDQWVLPQIIDFDIDRKNPRLEIELEVRA